MKNYILNSSTYGKLILLIGLLIAFPVIVLPFYPEEIEYLPAFLLPALITFILGIVVCILSPQKEEKSTEWQSNLQRGSLPVLFAWCFSFFIGALPFVFAGELSFILALFESVSGWTTTGLTVADVAAMPHIFLFHRSFMQYCGGLGFIIVIIMLIHGKQSMSLYSAEGHADRLMPSLKKTARAFSSLYLGFLVMGTLAYRIFGMGLFDAVCHTMAALSTAGFSTKANSIGEYGSMPIEIVTVILMLIGATNFAVLFLMVKRKFKQMFRISELRFMLGLVLVFTIFCMIPLMREMHMGFGESFMDSLFGVVTTFSTTGYSTMNYSVWPSFGIGLIMLLMIIGGSTGSTAGGIKLARAYLLIRITRENIVKRISPDRQITSPSYHKVQGKTLIDDAIIKDTLGFIACYAGVFMMGTLLITLTADCSLEAAMYEFASAFGTVGISNGLTNAGTDNGTLIIEMIGMLLGRLEIFIVFIGVYSGFKSLKHLFKRKGR